MEIIKINNLTKIYGDGVGAVKALDHVDISIKNGEFVTIVGASGSGKSTLLNIIAGLDVPTEGSILVNNIDISRFNERQLVVFRRRNIGFVFQDYNLLSVLNSYDNIVLPFTLDKMKKIDHEYVKYIMESLKIWDKRVKYPNELSGGQQQRVAIARALITKPCVILADEPTGNLDSKTAMEVIILLKTCSKEFNQTLIVVTHDEKISQLGDSIIRFKDGSIL